MPDFNLLAHRSDFEARLIRFPSGAGASGGGNFRCLLAQQQRLIRFPSAPPNRLQANLTTPLKVKRFYMRGWDSGLGGRWVTWSSIGSPRTNPAATETNPNVAGVLSAVHIELSLPEND